MLLKIANLSLLFLFPIAWFAPLLQAGISLPLFNLNEITVISGMQGLWETDVVLALLVTFFAIFCPYLKTIGLGLMHWNLLDRRVLPALNILGKLAMADVFLIALIIIVMKGVSVKRVEVEVETGWGLYLFAACVIASIGISWMTARQEKAGLS